MPAAAIPIIIYAASEGYGIYSAHKAQSTLENQANQQRQDSQGILGQQRGLAGQLTGLGVPAARQATGYYSTMLNGSRGQMRLATAGARGAVNDTYKGAERSAASKLTGGARDTAIGELERNRAGQVAGLTTGVQPEAAAQLGQLSGGLLGQGSASLGNAGLTSANLLSSANSNLWQQRGADAQSAAGWGKLLASLMSGLGGKGGGTSGLLPSQILAPRAGGLPNVSPSGNMGDY